MKIPAFVIAVVSLFGAFTNFSPGRAVNIADQTIDYQVSNDKYAVVIVMDGISSAQARKAALRRAAEITVEQGNRYFVINSEGKTQVAKTDDNGNEQKFYGNMYQELIIEKDFGRDRNQINTLPVTQTYAGYRIVFTSYANKPGLSAVDACTLTNCDQ